MDHAQDVLDAVCQLTGEELPFYSQTITSVFLHSQPIFTRKRYEDFFWQCASTVPGWLTQVVLSNALVESEGSSKRLALWRGVIYNREVEDHILFHAKDESRHSQLFLDLAQLAFPKFNNTRELAGVRNSLTRIEEVKLQKSNKPLDEAQLIDHLVQMNIGEIRTRIHVHLLAPVIHAFAPEQNKKSVRRILKGLSRDEVRHIGYTARLIENWASTGDGKLISELYYRRLREFNRLTVEQTEPALRQFGQGLFPDLLEI